MDALPYYKWYWIDYRANRKVQRMGWQARGLYRELLDEFWSEGILPNDTAALADICGCDHTTFLLHWPQIQGCWEETPDGLINAKMDAQRTEVDASRVAKAKAGAKGGSKSNSYTRDKQMEANAKEVLAQPDIAEQSMSRAEQSTSRELRASKTNLLAAPLTLAKLVQERTGLLTEGCCKALTAVIRREQNIGIPSEQIVTALCDAWADYQKASPELAVTFGAEKFFGEGKWKDRESWGWRNNGTTKTGQSLDAAREAIRRIEVEADRRSAGDFGDSQTGEARPGGLPSLRG